MSRRKRKHTITIEQLIAASPDLKRFDDLWRSMGAVATKAQLFPCQDGSHTARVVWRRPGAVPVSATCLVRGLVLA
ncbi:hypothetical protein V5F77_28695 [Xanthobacter sp. DSM 24535]|uniref:hypothetical protein n=1 Tax=Roseixanthobacter psychrophilus TaxID=3119917 RepID=UPI0037299385